MNIDHLYVVDTDSGTFFRSSSAYLMDFRKLDDQELVDFVHGTDSDRSELGERYGTSIQWLVDTYRPSVYNPGDTDNG